MRAAEAVDPPPGYLADSKYSGQSTFRDATQFSDCIELNGDGTMQVLGGTFMGTWAELPLIAGLTLRLPFVTFWRGQLSDASSTQFTGIVFFGIMFDRIIQIAPLGDPNLGRFLGVRTMTCT